MMKLLDSLKSRFMGKKVERVERRRSQKTGAHHHQAQVVGACLVHHHLKMKVTETKSDELWKWLLRHGWHVAAFPNDRRRYHLVPEETYARLDLAPTSERPMIIRHLLRQHGR